VSSERGRECHSLLEWKRSDREVEMIVQKGGHPELVPTEFGIGEGGKSKHRCDRLGVITPAMG
jgi:hypothetical protein